MVSNGVINLCPDKATVLAEAFRVLKPGGRSRSPTSSWRQLPECAKQDIALWIAELPVLSWKESCTFSKTQDSQRSVLFPPLRHVFRRAFRLQRRVLRDAGR